MLMNREWKKQNAKHFKLNIRPRAAEYNVIYKKKEVEKE